MNVSPSSPASPRTPPSTPKLPHVPSTLTAAAQKVKTATQDFISAQARAPNLTSGARELLMSVHTSNLKAKLAELEAEYQKTKAKDPNSGELIDAALTFIEGRVEIKKAEGKSWWEWLKNLFNSLTGGQKLELEGIITAHNRLEQLRRENFLRILTPDEEQECGKLDNQLCKGFSAEQMNHADDIDKCIGDLMENRYKTNDPLQIQMLEGAIQDQQDELLRFIIFEKLGFLATVSKMLSSFIQPQIEEKPIEEKPSVSTTAPPSSPPASPPPSPPASPPPEVEDESDWDVVNTQPPVTPPADTNAPDPFDTLDIVLNRAAIDHSENDSLKVFFTQQLGETEAAFHERIRKKNEAFSARQQAYISSAADGKLSFGNFAAEGASLRAEADYELYSTHPLKTLATNLLNDTYREKVRKLYQEYLKVKGSWTSGLVVRLIWNGPAGGDEGFYKTPMKALEGILRKDPQGLDPYIPSFCKTLQLDETKFRSLLKALQDNMPPPGKKGTDDANQAREDLMVFIITTCFPHDVA